MNFLKILCSISLLIPSLLLAQSIQIDSLKIKLPSSLGENSEAILLFPKIELKNKKNSALVNMELKDRITDFEFTNKIIEQSYRDWGQYASYTGFEILMNEKEFVSFEIYGEFCGAYCSDFHKYLNFNSSTGKFYSLNEVVDTSAAFRNLVYMRLDSIYQNTKKEYELMQISDTNQVDSAYFPVIWEELENCRNDFTLKDFSMTPQFLIIRKNCDFPHYMRNFGPMWEIRFSWNEIRKFLKIQL